MSSRVLINSELSKDSFKIIHSEEIWITPAWSSKSNSNSSVVNLIVPLEHQRWCEKWLFLVGNFSIDFRSYVSEMLTSQFLELSLIDFSSTWNYDIFSNVEFVVEFLDLLRSDWVNVVPNSPRWLSKIMISESGVMNILVSDSFRVFKRSSIFIYAGLFSFNLWGIKCWL